MIRTRLLLAVAVVGALVAAVMVRSGPTLKVMPTDDAARAIAGAAPGTTIHLAPGDYSGTFDLPAGVTVDAHGAHLSVSSGAEVGVSIRSPDVTVRGLTVEGGESGIVVRETEGVVLEDVTVTGADLHGIEVVDAAAEVTRATVTGLRHSLAQGIEIRNSDGRPDTIVQDSTVVGGQEGIVTHVSEVEFLRNEVSETTMRGIVVTEMSDGIVIDNVVRDAAGAGFYCGDMSRCSFERNEATGIEAGYGGKSIEGWGLVVTYHASAWSSQDDLGGAAGDVLTSLHGKMLARSPLDPGKLSDIALPGALSLLVTVLLMIGAMWIARPLVRRLRRAGPEIATLSALAALALVLAVQSFHMFEHALQVHRVAVDHVPSRGGLAGPGVDTEWVHLAYNLTLVAFLFVLAFGSRRMPAGASSALAGAALIQGWHGIEHVAKVIQHVTTGAKVNPGVLGGYFDLVWFHFTINLAVYGLCLIGGVVWLVTFVRARAALAKHPDAVPA